MDSFPRGGATQVHVVCVPFPAQGHVNPMMKLAKLLHSHAGFHVTFVHTEYNAARLLHSRGPRALDGLPGFNFASIPDGLGTDPSSGSTQDIPSLCASVERHCLGPFKALLTRLNDGRGPAVTCIVADVVMPVILVAAEEMGIKVVNLWAASACGFLAYHHYPELLRKGYVPLKDASDLTNGYLNTSIDWIPTMKGIRLKDFPSFIQTTNPDDFMLNYPQHVLNTTRKLASAIVFSTFEPLERDVLEAIAPDCPPLYAVGPLHKLVDRLGDSDTAFIPSSLWKEDNRCLEWLDSQEPGSVVYVNFGSITVMTNNQLVEFALGLAGSGKPFLWIIRPDLVTGESAVLPPEFMEDIKGRSMLADWCHQEKVLAHSALGAFLTHGGWNSVMESVCIGVAMVMWPFFSEQQTNCWFSCMEWGIGMEIDSKVRREVVEKQVRELMEGEKGKEMKKKALEWKGMVDEAVVDGEGQSWMQLQDLIAHIVGSNGEKK